MKKTLFSLICLTAITSVSAYAAPQPKRVALPFSDLKIVTKHYRGLLFNYDMSGTPAKKIVCDYKDVYKSWTEFKNDGVAAELGVFGGSGTFIMTNKGNTDGEQQWHADVKGAAKIMSYRHKDYPNQTVSCRYEVEQ